MSLLFLGRYRLSFYKPQGTSEIKEEISVANPIDFLKKESEKISVISDEAVLSPTLSPDGLSIKYYSQKNERAYQIDLDGTNKKEISDKEGPGESDPVKEMTGGDGFLICRFLSIPLIEVCINIPL